MVFCKAGWQTRHWRRERLKGDVQFEIMLEKGKTESCLGEISRLFRVAISKGWLPAVRIRVVVLVRVIVPRRRVLSTVLRLRVRAVAAVPDCGWGVERCSEKGSVLRRYAPSGALLVRVDPVEYEQWSVWTNEQLQAKPRTRRVGSSLPHAI